MLDKYERMVGGGGGGKFRQVVMEGGGMKVTFDTLSDTCMSLGFIHGYKERVGGAG